MDHYFIVKVTTSDEDADRAAEVINERIYHDEDYGFEYTIEVVGEPTSLAALGYTVTITRSGGTDGAVVIFIDGPDDDGTQNLDGSPGCRIRLNDDPVYVGTPYGHVSD